MTTQRCKICGKLIGKTKPSKSNLCHYCYHKSYNLQLRRQNSKSYWYNHSYCKCGRIKFKTSKRCKYCIKENSNKGGERFWRSKKVKPKL